LRLDSSELPTSSPAIINVSYFTGDPSEEQRVLDWIFENRNEQSIVNISRATLNDLVTERDYIAVIFCKFVLLLLLSKKVNFSLLE